MPTIISILTFISRINGFGDLNLKFALIMAFSLFISSLQFILSIVGHEYSFITSGPDHVLSRQGFYDKTCGRRTFQSCILQTSPCNEYPLTSHLLYSKVVVYRGITYFLFFAPKDRLWVHVRNASLRRF